ncbi:MAG TPA: DMT family transporter [Fibrobacteraceae bacterium]|nr:DMT family transporter [Fibrobacteraceae bacterium]
MEFFFWTLGPAALLALGNILQKIGLSRIAHLMHPKRPLEWIAMTARNSLWWIGIVVSAVATIGYFGALGKYNLSLVQPLMALNPVLTALVGWLCLKEHLDTRTGWGIFFVVAGLVFTGVHGKEMHGVESNTILWAYATLLAMVILGVRLLVHMFEARKSVIGGIGFGLSALFMKSLEGHFVALGGLNLQGAGEWFGPAGRTILSQPEIWGRFLGFTLAYGLGFVYTQVGLTQGRALFVVPLSAAVGMLVPSVAGILVFQEPCGPLKTLAIALILLGSLLFVRLRDEPVGPR